MIDGRDKRRTATISDMQSKNHIAATLQHTHLDRLLKVELWVTLKLLLQIADDFLLFCTGAGRLVAHIVAGRVTLVEHRAVLVVHTGQNQRYKMTVRQQVVAARGSSRYLQTPNGRIAACCVYS